uniref:transient receptor potential cation channel subfamily V member 5-like isoform X2 n=1 Tax=Myxine glutinosa TaxID=7769 RepID=UPI00358F9C98
MEGVFGDMVKTYLGLNLRSTDELYLHQLQNIRDVPLFSAAKENDVELLHHVLNDSSQNLLVRGPFGETALHVAVLYGSISAAKTLLNAMPSLVNEPMIAEPFYGQTPLHIAVLQQHIDMTRLLIEHGADVARPRAFGSYFPRTQEGQLLFGEHILSFAATTGNEEIVSLLLENGAQVDAQDSNGNTVLHILALHSEVLHICEVYNLIMSHATEDSGATLETITNQEGFTPFKLAAKEGNMAVRHILESSPVKQLLWIKWRSFGRKYLRFWMMLYLWYMTSFTLSCIYRPIKARGGNITDPRDDIIMVEKDLSECYHTSQDFVRLTGELVTVMGAIIIIFLEIPGMRNINIFQYVRNSVTGGPFHIILICFSCIIFVTLFMRLMNIQGQGIPMSIALVLGWCNTMYFARAFEMLGPFAIMIQKMLFGDFLKAFWLIFMVLMGFTSALYLSFQTLNPENWLPMENFFATWFLSFQLFIGVLEIPLNYSKHTPVIVLVIYIVYMIISFLVMINMLVAVMADTHGHIANEQDELWIAQVAATTILLERRLPRWLCPRVGNPGLKYGLGERWFLRVNEHCGNEFPKATRSDASNPRNPRQQDMPMGNASAWSSDHCCKAVRKAKLANGQMEQRDVQEEALKRLKTCSNNH